MKRYTLRFRRKDERIFLDIRSGAKRVETRAATERHKNMAAGESVRFVCGGKEFSKKIRKARYFKGVSGLLKVYKVADISTTKKTKKELIEKYHSFPGYREKLQKFGLVALEFK